MARMRRKKTYKGRKKKNYNRLYWNLVSKFRNYRNKVKSSRRRTRRY